MKRSLLLFILLIILGGVFAQNKSNKGKEFWVGYGHNQLMGATGTTNNQSLVLYLSAEQPANVLVTIPSVGFSQNYPVAGNSVTVTVVLPTTNVTLLAEGLSSKGIHIESDVPIVAYAHQYGGSSSGATMLMPVETYGYTYYSLNYTQVTNSTPAYSWFFVVASEDNTKVEITPSAATQGGKAAGVMFTATLNKGQIYNVWGASSGTTGNDMTGSKIVSVAGGDGNCHPIGVFSGASRMTICNTSSGEFMWQQIFPASAWGTRYLTYPTVSTNGVNIANINFFRVAVRDPSTVVKRNGVILTGIVNNFYYDFSSTSGDYIEADKPILVEQLTPSTSSTCSGYSGLGDPEMFYLSPIEQAIKKAVFYTTTNSGISQTYVCAIVPSNGLNSLKIDGSSTFDRVTFHPQNTNYRIAIKTWAAANQQHTIECDSAFTAITYGFGNVESYGYNAGTLINNLNVIGGVQNTLNPISNTATNTCKNTPFNFSIKMSYKPTTLVWKFSQVTNLNTNIDTTLTNPIAYDSSIVNGRRYWEYRLPGQYTFSDTGTYTIPLLSSAPVVDNCNNTENLSVIIKVNRGPIADFTWNYTGCISDTAQLFGTFTSPPGTNYTVNRYRWLYDDATTDSVQNPKKKFNTQGGHPTKLTTISVEGCVGDTVKIITTSPSPIATFGMSILSTCNFPTSVTFTDTSSFAGSPLNSWYWNFGNGNIINATTNAPQTQTYNFPGTYTIKHVAGVASGCGSDTAIKQFIIYATPFVNFGFTKGCLQDSTVYFTDSTTVADLQPVTYSWNFGDPNATVANPNTSTLQNPTHKYSVYGTYNVTLTATTVNGCVGTKTIPYTVQGFGSAIVFNVQNETSLCANNVVKLTNQSAVVADSVYRIDIYWDFVNNPTTFITDNTPTPNEVYQNTYPLFTTPLTKTYTIKWIVFSKGGCTSEKTKTITINAKPALSFATLQGVCVNAATSSVAQASVTNGVTGTGVYSGVGVDAAGNFNAAVAGVGVKTIKYVFISSTGCTDSITQTIRVFPKPSAKFGFNRNICATDSIKFSDSSAISSGTIAAWNWSFGDGTIATYTNGTPFFHQYLIANSGYPVKLYVTSDSACLSDTFSTTVAVRDRPQAKFGFTTQRCAGSTLTFTDSSIANGNTIQNWYWNFGNGQTLNAPNGNAVNSTYPTAGNYTVKLVVNGGLGCVSDTAALPLTIFAKPVVNFTTGSGCLQDSTLQFTDATTISDAQTLNYAWNFGDPNATVANPNTSTIQNPSHRYTAYQSYSVNLTVTTANGCSNSITKPFSVFGFLPTIAFNVANENSLCASNQVKLTNQTTTIGIDSIYRIDIYWDFANQPGVFITDNTPTPNEVYQNLYPSFTTPATKTYTIKWVVYSKGGCVSSITKDITLNAKPVLSFATLAGKCINAGTSSVAQASVSNGLTGVGVHSGPGTDAAGNFDPAIAGVGLHIIKYVFAASGGCKDSISQTIRVFPKPVARLGVGNAVCQGVATSFTDTSSIANGTIANWYYNFGDGTTPANNANGNPFTYTYAAYGNYNVQLVVTSDSSCVSDTSSKIAVVNPVPVPDFTLPASVCIPAGIASFTNTSTIGNGTLAQMNYVWNFGDGSATTTTINGLHTYAAINNYTIKLTATSALSCSKDTSKIFNTFFQQPVAKFALNDTTICQGIQTIFSDSSIAVGSNITNWKWSFGDGTTDTAQNPKKTYSQPGVYTIKLLVTSAQACVSDTGKLDISVFVQPVVDAGPDLLIYDSTLVVMNPTVNNTSLNFKWTPNTYFLTNDTMLRPTLLPRFNTLYKLTATGANGCTATDSVFIKVLKDIPFVPNAFSPNGDGINDKWTIPSLSNYPNCRVEVYNRYGQIVFLSPQGYTTPWDGTKNGSSLPVGTYYYIIEPKDKGYGKFSGSVTLLR
jgi:gliding motility-associated-like protein